MLSASSCLDWICLITGQSIEAALQNAKNFYANEDLTNIPYFLPYMSGERTPHNDPHVRGSFHYLKKNTNQAALQFSVIEGVCFGILDGINSIKSVNNNFDDIFMVGGGSRSSFWLTLLSSIIQRKLSVCDQSEFGAALGVARLAMFTDKNILDKELIIKKINVKNSFHPNDNKIDILNKRYNVWKNIYSNTKKINYQIG